jgi:phosphomannomutase
VVALKKDMHSQWDSIFHGYDVRGRYPDQIDGPTAYLLGRVLATTLKGPFVLARDVRRESKIVAGAVKKGIKSVGALVESVGVAPTPAVAFLARQRNAFGISVTPSHNAIGYAGLKGFGRSGRVFDREWGAIGNAFNLESRKPGRRFIPSAGIRHPPGQGESSSVEILQGYLRHLTDGLRSNQTIVAECRGGATAWAAPTALRTMGAKVVEVTSGFSPNFFGRSPEPRPEDLGELSGRIHDERAQIGFAFDGDGDRCVVVDERSRLVAPEVVALLLHRMVAPPRSPLVASVDASRVLERRVRTVRCRVGSRFVLRKMEQVNAHVGMEPSGHYYVRSYGLDSDGILVACLIANALTLQPRILADCTRAIGGLYRRTITLDFNTASDANRSFQRIVRALGRQAQQAPGGRLLTLPSGWCLVRCSSTQPSIRIAFEASSARGLRQLERETRRIEVIARAPSALEPNQDRMKGIFNHGKHRTSEVGESRNRDHPPSCSA